MSGKHAIRPGQPSAMARTMACAGWVARSQGIEDFHSEWAQAGSAAHALAAFCLTHGYSAAEFLGYWIDVEMHANGGHWHTWLLSVETPATSYVRVDEDMVEAVQFYVDICRSLKQDGDISWVETKLDCTAYHPDVWGTGDYGRFRPATGELVVLDFKFGIKIPVSPVENPQLLSYGLGACLLPETYGKVRSVWLGICQPRGLGEPIQWWHVDPAQLYSWGYEMARAVDVAINTAERGNAIVNLVAGAHCQFCPAFGVCETAAELATTYYDVARQLQDPSTPFTDPATYDMPALVRALNLAPYARKWAAEVAAFATREAEKGVVIPGYKLKDRQGHRKWKDEQQLRTFAEDNEIPLNRLYETKLKSPAQMEKVIGKTYRDFLEPLTTRPKLGATLVPESDPGATRTPTIHLEFQAREIEQ